MEAGVWIRMKSSGAKSVNQRGAWLILLMLLIFALAFVFVPALLLNPFRAQTPSELKIAFLLSDWAPVATLLLIIMAFVPGYILWHGVRRLWGKLILVIAVLPMLAAPWLAYQKPLEFLFQRLGNPDYVPTQEVRFLGNEDMVLAVELDGEAVAYPVRQVAYHHIVHDVIGGVSVVVTY